MIKFPNIAFVETTNKCNARCVFCPRKLMKREQRIMSLDEFKIIADKLKENGFKIQAMYSFGEPLTDSTLYEKYNYARSIDVLDNTVWLSTNCSLLTRDKFDKILWSMDCIILSIPNVFEDFEKMTGLSWDTVYKNATEFIRYRDEKRPSFIIYINVPEVKGHNKIKINEVFKEFKNIYFTRCTGVEYIGNSIKGTDHCDISGGFLTVRSNGECTSCCFDINCENSFGNIFTDSMKKIRENFLKSEFRLCKRCDYNEGSRVR